MNSSSIILCGTILFLLLIFICVALNASKFYIEMNNSEVRHYSMVKPMLKLHDRNIYRITYIEEKL